MAANIGQFRAYTKKLRSISGVFEFEMIFLKGKGKGDHGRIEYRTPDGFVFRDGFRGPDNDKHAEEQQLRKLKRAYNEWFNRKFISVNDESN